jgi:hypothetical protein
MIATISQKRMMTPLTVMILRTTPTAGGVVAEEVAEEDPDHQMTRMVGSVSSSCPMV